MTVEPRLRTATRVANVCGWLTTAGAMVLVQATINLRETWPTVSSSDVVMVVSATVSVAVTGVVGARADRRARALRAIPAT